MAVATAAKSVQTHTHMHTHTYFDDLSCIQEGWLLQTKVMWHDRVESVGGVHHFALATLCVYQLQTADT